MKKFLIVLLALSLLGNLILYQKVSNQKVQPVEKSSNNLAALMEKYPHLSVRALNDNPQDLLLNFLDLRSVLRQKVADYGDSFKLYFEYLPTGTTVNINGNDEFYAASLFKVPVVMAYYRWKERTGITDDQEIEVLPDQIDKQFGKLWEKGAGTKLKISEAIRLALEESDNTAIKAVIPYIHDEDFNTVYNGLDITLSSDKDGALISAKNYSSILKSLYFSAILNRENSEEILKMLSNSSFDDKIVAGIPKGVSVAHKIGDFKLDGKEGYRDCGIVYVPRRPYLICLVSATDENIARDRMAEVSKIIYEYVTKKQ